MKGFAQSPIGSNLDALAQRYGTRPSSLAGLALGSGRALLLDLAIAIEASKREAESDTVVGQIRAKQSKWPIEFQRELERVKRG